MVEAILEKLGLVGNLTGVYSNGWFHHPGGTLVESINPSNGKTLAKVITASESDYQTMVTNAQAAFGKWSRVPAPPRPNHQAVWRGPTLSQKRSWNVDHLGNR